MQCQTGHLRNCTHTKSYVRSGAGTEASTSLDNFTDLLHARARRRAWLPIHQAADRRLGERDAVIRAGPTDTSRGARRDTVAEPARGASGETDPFRDARTLCRPDG